MKNSILLTVSLLLLVVLFSRAQTVAIPDANFAKCLSSRYQNVINGNGQLILSEAAKLQGTITCIKFNIESMEGLQYFTGVNNVVLQQNNINYIPDLSSLQKLRYLDLEGNNLNYLPDLSKLTGLWEVYAQRNKIKVLPDLSGNDSLQVLNVHTNQLDTLPDLSGLKLLRSLSVQYNNLKYLPNVEKLTSLQTLAAWKNQLLKAPPLDALTDLVNVDLSYNRLTVAPSLGTKTKLQFLYLNDNNINTLVDFSQCKALQNVRLYNNPLTFKEISRIVSVPKYDSIFKFNPQQPLLVGYSSTVREGDTLVLTTGLDRKVPNVVYEWYKNGNLIETSEYDSLLIPQTSLLDKGSYTCRIKRPGFSVVLSTNEFSVGVKECVDFGKVFVSTTEINCLNAGTITLTGEGLAFIQSYEITSKVSGKKHFSKDGKFTGLSETPYSLALTADNGCSKIDSTTIHLSQKDCEEVLMSPDGDGISDTYYFEEAGKVAIYDKRGQLVKSLSIPGEWDGSSEKGKVFSGFYVADINNGKKIMGITVLY